jgi:hypothetical protein
MSQSPSPAPACVSSVGSDRVARQAGAAPFGGRTAAPQHELLAGGEPLVRLPLTGDCPAAGPALRVSSGVGCDPCVRHWPAWLREMAVEVPMGR